MAEAVSVVRQERRVRTEEALLDAFQTVLVREGANNVTVQAVADEAQVAKTLIYRYFDGIGGLIKAWAGQRDVFVPLEELFPDPELAAKELYDDPFQFAKHQILKQAEHLRKQPAYVELCLAELSGSGPVVDALMDLRHERNEAESKRLGAYAVAAIIVASRYYLSRHARAQVTCLCRLYPARYRRGLGGDHGCGGANAGPDRYGIAYQRINDQRSAATFQKVS